MICEFLARCWRVWKRNPAWPMLTVLAVAFTVVANPSAKPPTSAIRVAVKTSTTGITVTPSCDDETKARLTGKTAIVQLKKEVKSVVEIPWVEISRVEDYDFSPIVVEGSFVSGGKEILRRIKIIFE